MMLNSTTLVSAQRISGSRQSLRVAGPKTSFGGRIHGSRGVVVRAEGAGMSRVVILSWRDDKGRGAVDYALSRRHARYRLDHVYRFYRFYRFYRSRERFDVGGARVEVPGAGVG